MQDLSTGEMRDLTPFLKDIPKVGQSELVKMLQNRLDEACKAIESDPRKRGPVFELGEVLEIRGGKFKVAEISKDGLFLKGVPSI